MHLDRLYAMQKFLADAGFTGFSIEVAVNTQVLATADKELFEQAQAFFIITEYPYEVGVDIFGFNLYYFIAPIK